MPTSIFESGKPLYTSTPQYDYVGTLTELRHALERLAEQPYVAVDTEFLRERTYFPAFCLLQLAHEDYCCVIDVLALPTLAPVLDFLNDRNRLKLFHAAQQDLEVLALARGAQLGLPVAPIAGPFVDTQVLASFLDMPAQIGYADLVQRRLHLSLDKTQTRTDWSRRPLTAEQLRYAADDVVYLVQLYFNLKEALGHTLRWGYMEDDAAEWENPKLYYTDPAEAWQRLRGLPALEPEHRAAAKALARWRETRAIAKDRPRAWILSDDALLAIATLQPSSLEQLAKISGLPNGFIEKRGQEVLDAVSLAKSKAAEEPPARECRPTRAQQVLIRNMMETVRKTGASLHISPERLASRRDVEGFVLFDKSAAFLYGWRERTVGRTLIAAKSKFLSRAGQEDEVRQRQAKNEIRRRESFDRVMSRVAAMKDSERESAQPEDNAD